MHFSSNESSVFRVKFFFKVADAPLLRVSLTQPKRQKESAKNIMPRTTTSILSLPMTREEDTVLRAIHRSGKRATPGVLYRMLEPQGIGKFEIKLCLGSLKDDGYLMKHDYSDVYCLTGDGLHHVRFVKPVKDSTITLMLRAALIAGLFVWMAEALTGIKAFGDAGSLMVSMSVATSLAVTVYRWVRSP